ncbi:MAG TPA: flagellar motor protein MotB [Microscillaceae bacterium]|nr:flagellar motor protein MotB [Microscillaceae bacterium]
MKWTNYFIAFILYLTSQHLWAQTTQWSSQVLQVSSQRIDTNDINQLPEPHIYRAQQILGIPNKLPAFGSSKCAWSPSRKQNPKGEWIKVAFRNPMKTKQIAIAENYNPGAISKIYAYDPKGAQHLVYENKQIKKLAVKGRMFRVILPKITLYQVKSLKVFLNTQLIPGYNQIDAIGISDGDAPVEAKINISKQLDLKSKAQNLGENVNSPYDEVSPIVTPDGSGIYFTRFRHPQNIGKQNKQDVWYAETRPDRNFRRAKNLGPPINNEYHNSSFSISPDGNTMLLNNVYLPTGRLGRGLSITRRGKDGKWQLPEKVEIDGFKNLYTRQEFCLSSNGKVLLMTIQQEDTQGGKDIYVSFLKADGKTWTKPKNLGKTVNTAEHESSPFLAVDGTTLYYSTSGMSGYGRNDIFVTRRLDNSWTKWSTPQNLGPTINSNEWEAYFSIPAKADFAYFVSYKRGLQTSADILRVSLSDSSKPKPVALIKGRVLNAKTKQPLQANIGYEILETGKNVGKGSSNPKNGTYQIVLPLENEYALLAEAKGYLSNDTTISLKANKKYTEIVVDLYLTPIEKGGKIRLNNIFFNRGSARLLPQSYSELDRLVKSMKENPSMKIRLEGHTEIFGNKKMLMTLSEERVKSVQKYLAEKGINNKRVKLRGYGPKRPLSTDKDPKLRAKNRRVEVVILSK